MVRVHIQRTKAWWLPWVLLYGSSLLVGFAGGVWLISLAGATP